MTSTTSSTEPTPTHRPPSRATPGRALTIALVVGCVILAIVVARLLLSAFQPHLYSGTVLQSPTPAPAMTGLEVASGEPFDIASFDGDVVLVYFGYTNCPDVCPTTLATAAQARASLSDSERERTQVVMVSVDPDRDPLEQLQAYVEFFDADFIGVGGPIADVQTAATQYGIYYARNDDPQLGYTIDHTANLLGIGPDGTLRLVWAPDVTSDALAADIAALLG